jgi:putative endonuclease
LKAVFEVGESRGEADRLEKFIKRQKSRRLIESLINPDFVPEGKLAQLVRVPHVRD